MSSQSNVIKLYQSVIDDVISGVREAFLDEGVDEQVLQELKTVWEVKLLANKAVEPNPEPLEPAPPQLGQKSNSKSGAAKKTQAAAAAAVAAAAAAAAAAAVVPTSAAENAAADAQGPIPSAGSSNGTVIHNQAQLGVLQATNHVQQVNQIRNPLQQQTNQIPTLKNHTIQPQSLPLSQPQQLVPPTHGHGAHAAHAVLAADPNRQVPIQITLPAQAGVPDAQPRVLTIQVPASAITGNQLQQVLTGPVISATMSLPLPLACSLLQQHVTAALQGQAAAVQMQSAASSQNNGVSNFGHQGQASNPISQLDGALDSSDEDEDEDDDDDDIDDDEENDDRDEDDNDENEGGAEEEPLNSGDDVSDEDPQDLFDTENVVVCQYDKITRSRNKWKFYLKDGIMNLNGKDYVFQRANGDAEW